MRGIHHITAQHIDKKRVSLCLLVYAAAHGLANNAPLSMDRFPTGFPGTLARQRVEEGIELVVEVRLEVSVGHA